MQPGPASSLRLRTSRFRSVRSDASLAYRVAVAFLVPVVRWWGRLEVVGAELIPHSGPVLLVANHDSAWDPPIIGVASVRRRQVHALARGSLWGYWGLGWLMTRLGAIPVSRETSNEPAVATAVEHLDGGLCVGLFPEGMVSRGRTLRARSGAGRLALAMPSAQVVCAAISGSTNVARFPLRPRLRITFFLPAGVPPYGDSAAEVSARLLEQIRAVSPPAPEPRVAVDGKPRWRGWMHLVGFEISLVVGTLLVAAGATGARERTAVSVYVASVSGLFGVSALYHRGTWGDRLRVRLQRLDHLMIFVLMAGTTTPLLVVASWGPYGIAGLVVVWVLAALAAWIHLTRMTAPDWVMTSAIAVLSCVGALALGFAWSHIPVAAGVLFIVGGALYSIGGLSLHRRSPDPWPAVFGYHEVFHTYVTIAAVCHFVAVALLVL